MDTISIYTLDTLRNAVIQISKKENYQWLVIAFQIIFPTATALFILLWGKHVDKKHEIEMEGENNNLIKKYIKSQLQLLSKAAINQSKNINEFLTILTSKDISVVAMNYAKDYIADHILSIKRNILFNVLVNDRTSKENMSLDNFNLLLSYLDLVNGFNGELKEMIKYIVDSLDEPVKKWNEYIYKYLEDTIKWVEKTKDYFALNTEDLFALKVQSIFREWRQTPNNLRIFTILDTLIEPILELPTSEGKNIYIKELMLPIRVLRNSAESINSVLKYHSACFAEYKSLVDKVAIDLLTISEEIKIRD